MGVAIEIERGIVTVEAPISCMNLVDVIEYFSFDFRSGRERLKEARQSRRGCLLPDKEADDDIL